MLNNSQCMQIKSTKNYNRILIAIPAYNEQKNISNVLKDISKYFKNILVIDNNSQDHTIEEVKKFPVFLISHKYNLGKSESMKTALQFAKIKKFKYLAFIDADGQHKANDLIKVCNNLYKNNYDLVIGYRKNLQKLNLKKRIGTIILQNIFYLLYQKKILDIQSGLRAFNLSIEKKIYWYSTGINHYFADAEITCNATINKCNICQIPIETLISENYKGMNIIQGLYLIIMIIYWRIFN